MFVVGLARRALIGGLAITGALYLGVYASQWLTFTGNTAPSSVEIVGSVAAPDEQHKAVIFFLAGPGFAPGSHQYVGVVPTAQVDDPAWADRNKIFQSDCGALGETHDEMKKSVIWKSAQTLQITFDPNRGCALIKPLAGRPGFNVVYVVPPPN